MASLSKAKKHLSCTTLRRSVSSHCRSIEDTRQQTKCHYSQHDAIMSAFVCMYFQDPSLAQFQQRMEEAHHENNLRTLFAVDAIPKDSRLREILDNLPGESFTPIFKDLFNRLRRHKHLED